MKALFVGLDSISQRHLRNFRVLEGDDAEILVFCNTNYNLVIEQGQTYESDWDFKIFLKR